MLYAIAASLIALVHFAFLLFVVFGAFLGRRSRLWRYAHLAAMAYGVMIEVFYWYCPLTYVEQYLWRASGGKSYEEPFIAHYLNKLIYIDISQEALIVAAVLVLGINAFLYAYWFYRGSHVAQ